MLPTSNNSTKKSDSDTIKTSKNLRMEKYEISIFFLFIFLSTHVKNFESFMISINHTLAPLFCQ